MRKGINKKAGLLIFRLVREEASSEFFSSRDTCHTRVALQIGLDECLVLESLKVAPVGSSGAKPPTLHFYFGFTFSVFPAQREQIQIQPTFIQCGNKYLNWC